MFSIGIAALFISAVGGRAFGMGLCNLLIISEANTYRLSIGFCTFYYVINHKAHLIVLPTLVVAGD